MSGPLLGSFVSVVRSQGPEAKGEVADLPASVGLGNHKLRTGRALDIAALASHTRQRRAPNPKRHSLICLAHGAFLSQNSSGLTWTGCSRGGARLARRAAQTPPKLAQSSRENWGIFW
eukprot:CAMPEP_0172646086 /NCGR_PEP_ID=MMETSP1068-20121228/240061_1 /TAXON_ID=35684 /ORGANISM="Pseudopedinella elastica, Strain CCMP716" /LENGTH=117 /DNA_ID=CAMNT_0013460337 /DNA_START=1001 /DNA_END=1351 /DNA_ORIENTATION=+